MLRRMDNAFLARTVEMLIRHFGIEVVRDKVELQAQMRTIDRLAECMSGIDPTDTTRKINRIRMAHALEIANGLSGCKLWVEKYYIDNGKALFIT